MICLDSSFVIDYWRGNEYTKEFLLETPQPVGIPIIALYELFVGAARSDSPSEDIGTVIDDLDWAEPLPFTESAARGAAVIDTHLIENGNRINALDVLIAATARAQNTPLVTTHSHFERIPNLELQNPRAEH